MNECLEFIDIFEGRRTLETGIEVDAYALGVMEVADARSVVWADAATEKERRLTDIIGKHIPIELLTAAARELGLGVEQEVIGKADIGGGLLEIGGSGDVEGLDNGDGIATDGMELADVGGGFLSVELDEVESVVLAGALHLVDVFIDEDTDARGVMGQVGGTL